MEYTENDIRRYLGDIIFYRAKEYHLKDKVLGVMPELNSYHGDVMGSGGRIYDVEIGYDGHHTCSCPYKGPCKHIGAVLLELLDIDEKIENFDPVEEFRKYKPISSGWIKEFDRNSFSKENWKEFGVDNSSKSKFTLQFQVVCSNTVKPVIKPVLRYIKKDGTPGRSENLSFSKNVEYLDDNDRFLLDQFSVKTDFENPLPQSFPMFQKFNKNIFYKDKVVTTANFNRVEVSFKPDIRTNDNINFIPIFNLYNSDELIASNIPLRDTDRLFRAYYTL